MKDGRRFVFINNWWESADSILKNGIVQSRLIENRDYYIEREKFWKTQGDVMGSMS